MAILAQRVNNCKDLCRGGLSIASVDSALDVWLPRARTLCLDGFRADEYTVMINYFGWKTSDVTPGESSLKSDAENGDRNGGAELDLGKNLATHLGMNVVTVLQVTSDHIGSMLRSSYFFAHTSFHYEH